MLRYRHTQIGWVHIGALAAAATVALSALASVAPGPAFLLLAGFVALVLLAFGWLTVTVDETRLEARFGIGLIRKRVALDEIRAFRAVRNRWYYGWGIRYVPGGWLYNVSGLSAVELRLGNGRLVRIGTDEPDALCEALSRRLGEPAPLSAEERESHRQAARRLFLVAASVGAAIVLVVGLFLYVQARPPVVEVSPELFLVRSGAYGVQIPMDEIESVSLETEIPRIVVRTNGYAFRGRLRGHFRLETMGGGQLFLDYSEPPYVLVRTRSTFVFVNLPEPERTWELYMTLSGFSDAR
jgi:hypothetical protein